MRTTAPGHVTLRQGSIEIIRRRSQNEVGRAVEVDLPVEPSLLRQAGDSSLQQQQAQRDGKSRGESELLPCLAELTNHLRGNAAPQLVRGADGTATQHTHDVLSQSLELFGRDAKLGQLLQLLGEGAPSRREGQGQVPARHEHRRTAHTRHLEELETPEHGMVNFLTMQFREPCFQ